jgi:hypothetical protein
VHTYKLCEEDVKVHNVVMCRQSVIMQKLSTIKILGIYYFDIFQLQVHNNKIDITVQYVVSYIFITFTHFLKSLCHVQMAQKLDGPK